MKKQKIILITGAGSGLGKSIAEKLICKGHVVYGTYRTNNDMKIVGITFIKSDITSEKDNQDLIKKILQKEKQIDVIINNAGMTLSGPTLSFSAEDFQKILEINVIGPFRLMKIACSSKIRPSLIINITSLNAFLSLPNFGLYSASKHAMEALGLALRYELAPQTKIVNVAPGALKREGAPKMPHKPAREKFPFLNWIIPLTSQKDVAKVIVNLIDASNVPRRVIVGRDAQIINLMQRILPSFIFDRILFYIWNKK